MLAVERKGETGYTIDMKTKYVLLLIVSISFMASIFELLFRRFHSGAFLYVYIGLQLLVAPLLFYAIYREMNLNDKSETMSNKAAIFIFSGVGLMLVLVAIHALNR